MVAKINVAELNIVHGKVNILLLYGHVHLFPDYLHAGLFDMDVPVYLLSFDVWY